MNKNCFWGHSWGGWKQEEPKDMYFVSKWNKKPSLDYRLYIQKRFCTICQKIEIESEKIDY